MTLRTPRPGVGLAELPADVSAPVADFEIDTSDLSALARAYRGSGEPPIDEPTAVMRDIASRMTEEDILAVASYVQGLK